jgi:ketosteroid isomerase-like protein
MRTSFLLLAVLTMSVRASCQANEDLILQVRETEAAFAQTMADRDLDAFGTFLSEDVIFIGSAGALRGKAAVSTGWARFFDGERAPFSWEPEIVEVRESGMLAMSSGPVYDPDGNRIGTFNSVWAREEDGSWKIVFDKGCPPCECEAEP